MTRGTFICSFTTLDDLRRKDEGNALAVLKVLSQVKRYSIWDATRTQRMAHTFERIDKSGWIRTTGGAYPWIEFEITDAGRKALAR